MNWTHLEMDVEIMDGSLFHHVDDPMVRNTHLYG